MNNRIVNIRKAITILVREYNAHFPCCNGVLDILGEHSAKQLLRLLDSPKSKYHKSSYQTKMGYRHTKRKLLKYGKYRLKA